MAETVTALTIPSKADVPAYILNPELARQQNEDAAAGITTGMPPRIKANGKQFNLVDGNGEEKPYPPAKMVAGPDGNVYLRVIALKAKKEISKTLYLKAYNPNDAEQSSPDCFSNDGERPDPSVRAPQSEMCATCPQNAFGSGKDQNGMATKGKACADAKILAVVIPEFGVFELKIMPASLKNFGLYVKQLSAAGIPLGMAQTLIGFDMTASFPVYIFNFGGYVPEKSVAKLAELAQSPEVEEIVGRGMNGSGAKALPAATAAPAVPTEAEIRAKQAEAAAKAAEEKKKADAAAKKKKAEEAKAKKDAEDKAAAEAAAKAAAQNSALDLGLDSLDDTPETVEPELVSDDPTDDQLRLELGL